MVAAYISFLNLFGRCGTSGMEVPCLFILMCKTFVMRYRLILLLILLGFSIAGGCWYSTYYRVESVPVYVESPVVSYQGTSVINKHCVVHPVANGFGDLSGASSVVRVLPATTTVIV